MREAREEAGKPVPEQDGFPRPRSHQERWTDAGGQASVVLMGWGRAWG